MTGSTSGAGSSACTVKGGGGVGGSRGTKRSFGPVWDGFRGIPKTPLALERHIVFEKSRPSCDGKHLRCREFRLSVEGWWGVRGEEGGKKFVSDCLGGFGALSGTE